jgi:hypothetical protein
VRGHDLPAVVKLLEVHRGVPHDLLVGTREIDGQPSKGETKTLGPNVPFVYGLDVLS